LLRTLLILPDRFGIAGLVLFSLARNCCALDPGRAVSQYARQSWGTRNGLPKGQIGSIAQSADGYLWIATEQGPLRFDGLSFTLLRDSRPNSFALDHVLGLIADRIGGLWVRMPDPTLLRYQDDIFTAMRLTPNHDGLVTAMTVRQDGSLLFASKLDGIFTWSGTRFETLISRAALPTSPITSVAATASGDIWFGTLDSGLFHLHSRRLVPITAGLPDLKINCLLANADGELYVGSGRGLVRWDGTRLTQAGIPKSLNDTPIFAIARDRDANLWIGGAKGLLRLNSQGASLFGEADSGKPVTALFEDREGDLWAGSADELERIQDSAFIAYRLEHDQAEEHGGPIHADSQGRVWTGPVGGGLYILHDSTDRQFASFGLSHDEVYSIAGNSDDVWLGRKRQGLTHITYHDGLRTSRSYTRADGLPRNSVYAVHQSRDGTIWAGTLTAGVSHLHDGRLSNYTTADGLASNIILSIAEDAGGTMWSATPSGVSSFANNRWRTYRVQDGLPSGNVNTLFGDSSGTLWLGTLRGIAFIRSKIIVPSNLPPSLLGQIFGIAQDRLGSLWITTSNGLLRVDSARLLSGSCQIRTCVNSGFPTDCRTALE
jgi:ligand-binding sensor domain-containing protein